MNRPGEFGHDDHLMGFDAEEASGIQFWDILKTLLRWRWLILAIGLLGGALGVVVILQTVPLYSATATIEIQPQEKQILEGASIEPSFVADAEFMATQYTLLKSRSLAERVVEELGLASDARYVEETLDRGERVAQAASKVQKNLSAGIVGRSRIIEIKYISADPGEAARIANAVADSHIEAALERKYNATAYARSFIDERLQAAKTALEESEARFVAYAAKEGIIDLSSAGGSSVGSSLDATSLTALNDQLAEAQSLRIALEIRMRELKKPDQRKALESRTLEDLARRRADLVAAYDETRFTYNADFPELERLKSQIDGLDREAERERSRIVNGITAEYRTAASTERSIKARIEDLKGSLQNLRNRSIDYGILKRDVDTNRAQYEALLQRLKEISIADGVGASQIAIVDRARKPTAAFEPNISRILIQFAILSLGLGVGLAFLLEYIDDTIKSPEDLPTKLGIPALGAAPLSKLGDPLKELIDDPASMMSEAMASARISLQFSTPDGAPKCLLVTSVRAAEGKTSTCAALGVTFARLGKRVLIIDADMRKPSFTVGKGASVGILGLLSGTHELEDEIVAGAVPGLYLLPCTSRVPNPAEALASPRLQAILHKAREKFDLVIVDSPPILGFADAPTLSSLCDATMLVLQAGAIRRPAAARAIERLIAARANVIGAMLTKHRANRHGYGYGYSYSADYVYGDDGTSKTKKKKSTNRKVDIFDETDLSVRKSA
ncbi:MAG: polysaccharide biosynthesis tyrosine autokinase [Pseudomonadota bacterium]